MFRQCLRCEFSDNRTACGGFAIMNGTIKHSSIWLNQQSGSAGGLSWNSDGDKNLASAEQELVNFAVRSWASNGGGTLSIPDDLHRRCLA
mmetsp:Transcript_32065/g.79245  ORF Transcript_32065/g.79245 Transcript_32065/m.79245 type:complete len:90 (-) Transcript_32065:172-441(-)